MKTCCPQRNLEFSPAARTAGWLFSRPWRKQPVYGSRQHCELGMVWMRRGFMIVDDCGPKSYWSYCTVLSHCLSVSHFLFELNDDEWPMAPAGPEIFPHWAAGRSCGKALPGKARPAACFGLLNSFECLAGWSQIRFHMIQHVLTGCRLRKK